MSRYYVTGPGVNRTASVGTYAAAIYLAWKWIKEGADEGQIRIIDQETRPRPTDITPIFIVPEGGIK